ncbi:Zinc ribbon domain-containing protein, partial [Dysosmobacter welbionis]
AGAAPSSPEVQKHRLPLVVREGVGLAVLVRQGEVRSGDHGDLLAVRPAVLLLRIAGGGRLFAAVPGGLFLHRAGAGSQICGDAAGGAGEGQDAHDDQQHRADLHRVAHHILVGLEEIQHRAGEESHCQEGQY